MHTSFQHSKDRLLKLFLDFLWCQWSALGVAGQRGGDDDRVIDPESLLLATTRYGRYDSRLLDEVIDWLSSNGKRINLQRLRRIHDECPVADLRVLAAISGGLATQSMMRKWITLSDPLPVAAEPEPLFIRFDGSAFPIFHKPDPDFLRHGLLRDPMERRRMSQSPDPSRAANLLCCLRALFGVNARAEIVAWLLTHESGHPAAIARDTGYFSKSVQHTLNEMEDSGHIRSRREGWPREDLLDQTRRMGRPHHLVTALRLPTLGRLDARLLRHRHLHRRPRPTRSRRRSRASPVHPAPPGPRCRHARPVPRRSRRKSNRIPETDGHPAHQRHPRGLE